MITGINESDTLTKPVPCKCKYKFDDRKCNSNQNWNNDKCWCKCKKHKCEKDYIWNPAKCSCKNGKYLANIIEDQWLSVMKLKTQKLSCTTKRQKQLQQILVKKNNLQNTKVTYFTCIFVT